MRLSFLCVTALGLLGCQDVSDPSLGELSEAVSLTNNFKIFNPSGAAATFSGEGEVAIDGEFFIDFGTNQRTCASCHAPGEGWSIAAAKVIQRFNASDGLDPIFRAVDGATSPLAKVATSYQRRLAYRLLNQRGLIRVGIAMPSNAEFDLIAIDDPYQFASASQLSLFRRPLPATNLAFATTLMWDGRETKATLRDGLLSQAGNATLGHAQASALPAAADLDAIVDFEISLQHAQLYDKNTGRLDQFGANGGPQALANQALINSRFNLFDGWTNVTTGDGKDPARRAVARGQALFNNATGSGGFTCRSCHNAANVGSNVAGTFFDIGVSAGSRRTPDMPLYTLRRRSNGQTRTTTDPGRALVTGLWSDVDKFKTPALRGLAARAPYFHNGSAKTLGQVVDLYVAEFGFSFTAQQKADLVAFMQAL